MAQKKHLLFLILFITFGNEGLAQNCYQTYIKTTYKHKIKHIGVVKNQHLYAEILSFNNGGGN